MCRCAATTIHAAFTRTFSRPASSSPTTAPSRFHRRGIPGFARGLHDYEGEQNEASARAAQRRIRSRVRVRRGNAVDVWRCFLCPPFVFPPRPDSLEVCFCLSAGTRCGAFYYGILTDWVQLAVCALGLVSQNVLFLNKQVSLHLDKPFSYILVPTHCNSIF